MYNNPHYDQGYGRQPTPEEWIEGWVKRYPNEFRDYVTRHAFLIPGELPGISREASLQTLHSYIRQNPIILGDILSNQTVVDWAFMFRNQNPRMVESYFQQDADRHPPPLSGRDIPSDLQMFHAILRVNPGLVREMTPQQSYQYGREYSEPYGGGRQQYPSPQSHGGNYHGGIPSYNDYSGGNEDSSNRYRKELEGGGNSPQQTPPQPHQFDFSMVEKSNQPTGGNQSPPTFTMEDTEMSNVIIRIPESDFTLKAMAADFDDEKHILVDDLLTDSSLQEAALNGTLNRLKLTKDSVEEATEIILINTLVPGISATSAMKALFNPKNVLQLHHRLKTQYSKITNRGELTLWSKVNSHLTNLVNGAMAGFKEVLEVSPEGNIMTSFMNDFGDLIEFLESDTVYQPARAYVEELLKNVRTAQLDFVEKEGEQRSPKSTILREVVTMTSVAAMACELRLERIPKGQWIKVGQKTETGYLFGLIYSLSDMVNTPPKIGNDVWLSRVTRHFITTSDLVVVEVNFVEHHGSFYIRHATT